MEDVTLSFVFILLGGFVAALIVTLLVYLIKQRRVQRLKDPRKDHYRSEHK